MTAPLRLDLQRMPGSGRETHMVIDRGLSKWGDGSPLNMVNRALVAFVRHSFDGCLDPSLRWDDVFAGGGRVVDIKDEKKRLRAEAKVRRAEAFARHGAEAGAMLARHGLDFLGPRPGAAVSGFSAIGEEINPLALMLGLQAKEHLLALPVMQGKGLALVFRAWSPGDEMAPAVWGIAEPLASRPIVVPDIVLVPLLAFDGCGHRLGYGGGFYDRTLEQLRRLRPVLTVGIAYDEQRLDAVPHLDYDQPLDWVLTPSGPFACAR